MAYKESLVSITLPAGADFSTTGIYRFGEITGSDESAVTLCGAGDQADGVILDNQEAGVGIRFGISGVAMVELGATLNASVAVESGADGVAVAHDSGALLGKTLEAGESGDIVPVLLYIA